MNIAITLPLDLCVELLEGRKHVEIRKNYPRNFNCLTDKVYVIMKGTHKVVCTFTVKDFTRYNNIYFVWNVFEKLIRVPWKWFYDYAKNTKCLYVWNISIVSPVEPSVDAGDLLGLTVNPQSFVYVNPA